MASMQAVCVSLSHYTAAGHGHSVRQLHTWWTTVDTADMHTSGSLLEDVASHATPD